MKRTLLSVPSQSGLQPVVAKSSDFSEDRNCSVLGGGGEKSVFLKMLISTLKEFQFSLRLKRFAGSSPACYLWHYKLD